jgi:hypothetical protein
MSKQTVEELAAELRLVKPSITANFGGVHVDIGWVANAAADMLEHQELAFTRLTKWTRKPVL